mmetsp:Transcript_29984/g.34057  ORF Transcript_29984/g.34057 Transcript_29984/m.34057 type:complete len:212 (-) Transcript_29984:189-824(-)
MVGQSDYQVEVKEMIFGEGQKPLVRKTAILDSGTSYIAVPHTEIFKLYGGLPTNQCNCQVHNQCVCSCHDLTKYPDLTIIIGDLSITLRPIDYLQYFDDENYGRYCMPQFLSVENTDKILLGDTFLKKVVSVYDLDNHRIGLARNINESTINVEENNGNIFLLPKLSNLLYSLLIGAGMFVVFVGIAKKAKQWRRKVDRYSHLEHSTFKDE